MCGRVYQTYNTNQLLRIAGTRLIQNQDKNKSSYNIPPTKYLPAIKHADDSKNNNRVVDIMQWGFQPFGRLLFNARSEDPEKKNVWKTLVDQRRCVIIVEGYYEWTPQKVPYVFRAKESKDKEKPAHVFLAGIYSKNGEIIIMTRSSFGDAKRAHHRMPVILADDEVDKWLDCKKYKFNDIKEDIVLDESKAKWKNIDSYKVKNLVNSMTNNSKELLEPREEKESDYNTKAAASTKKIDLKDADEEGDKDFEVKKRGDETDGDFTDAEEEEEKEEESKSKSKKKTTPQKGKTKKGNSLSKKRKELNGRDEKNEFTPTTKRHKNNQNTLGAVRSN